MENPFDRKTQSELYDFFKQMTESINSWMLSKYPRFDATLEEKIKNLEHMQKKLASQNHEAQMKMESEKNNLVSYVQARIIEFMDKEYPDLNRRMQDAIKKIEKNSDKMEKQLEKVVSSQTLYEDFYKMRDELKEMRKFVETFTNNFKKLLNIKG